VDTAASLSNLGACRFCLNDLKEAIRLYDASYGILRNQLGVDHPRSIVVHRNIGQAREFLLKEYVIRVPPLAVSSLYFFFVDSFVVLWDGMYSFKLEVKLSKPIVIPKDMIALPGSKKVGGKGKKKKGKKKGKKKK
jgi:hypothetical protein